MKCVFNFLFCLLLFPIVSIAQIALSTDEVLITQIGVSKRNIDDFGFRYRMIFTSNDYYFPSKKALSLGINFLYEKRFYDEQLNNNIDNSFLPKEYFVGMGLKTKLGFRLNQNIDLSFSTGVTVGLNDKTNNIFFIDFLPIGAKTSRREQSFRWYLPIEMQCHYYITDSFSPGFQIGYWVNKSFPQQTIAISNVYKF